MIAVRYTLELLEPLLATELGGDPNTKRSYSYVPGSMIRGVAIGRYLAAANRRMLATSRQDSQSELETRLFLSDSTRYLNAYPTVERLGRVHRMLPTPRTWNQPKGTELEAHDEIYDLAVLTVNELDDVGYERLRQNFCL